jgi:hypothetical protein
MYPHCRCLSEVFAGILLSVPQTEIPQMTSQVLPPFGRNLLQFINLINIDREFADDVLTKEAIRLLGDLCKVPGLGSDIADHSNKIWITEFISNATDVPPGASPLGMLIRIHTADALHCNSLSQLLVQASDQNGRLLMFCEVLCRGCPDNRAEVEETGF